MPKLFAVLLGGRAERCNTELHDVVFVAGNTLEDTYPQLVQKWFGIHKRLHIDSVIELKFVDGHEIIIKDTPPENDAKKLFFVNFGGYQNNWFGEKHEVNFYVAASKPEVLTRAKCELGLSLIEPHCDDNVLVDDIINIDQANDGYIHLHPTTHLASLTITSCYRPLNAQQILNQK